METDKQVIAMTRKQFSQSINLFKLFTTIKRISKSYYVASRFDSATLFLTNV